MQLQSVRYQPLYCRLTMLAAVQFAEIGYATWYHWLAGLLSSTGVVTCCPGRRLTSLIDASRWRAALNNNIHPLLSDSRARTAPHVSSLDNVMAVLHKLHFWLSLRRETGVTRCVSGAPVVFCSSICVCSWRDIDLVSEMGYRHQRY